MILKENIFFRKIVIVTEYAALRVNVAPIVCGGFVFHSYIVIHYLLYRLCLVVQSSPLGKESWLLNLIYFIYIVWQLLFCHELVCGL